MLRVVLSLIAVAPLAAQIERIPWEQAPPPGCAVRKPIALELSALEEWTHHCAQTRDGAVRESFYYVFGEPARAALLRVDVHPVDESLRRTLTARFGAPDHQPEIMEIGFRHLRYGEPVNGDHWHAGGVHYFLHSNQTNPQPMGMRHGLQLIVLTDRLFAEWQRDAFIRQPDDRVRTRLKARVGELYSRPIGGKATLPDLAALLRESDRAGRPRRALYLLAAHEVANQLAQTTADPAPLRRLLAPYGAKVGGMTHQGGIDYAGDLLWRVWREFPETEGGELAFLSLQRRGWDTATGEGCPPDPDLFREVIDRGEAFLAAHPNTDFRREVIYSLAVANESWWSIAHSAPDDGIVADIPYPRRAANARQAEAARTRAIERYREVVRLAPGSAEAADALRRLPRLEIGLDTGQRRFFCTYC